MRRVIVLVVLFLALAVSAHATWPWGQNGTCSPATDLWWCLSCAGDLREACEAQCPKNEPLDQSECGRACTTEYRADLADCHGNFDPIVY